MLLLTLLLSLRTTAAVPSLSVSVETSRVVVAAEQTSLGAILAALADKTGINVVYDGPEPVEPVSVSVSAATVKDAVATLLEGQHLRYGLSADDKGRVTAVVVVTRNVLAPSPAVTPAPPAPSPTAPATRPDPVASIQEPPMRDHPSPPDE